MDNISKSFSIIHRKQAMSTERALRDLGIPYGQFMFILCICENEGRSQEWLSSELQMDKGFVARTIKNLERQGFVRRVVSEEDRRKNRIYPTEKAAKVYPEIVRILSEQERRLTEPLSDAEQYVLKTLLDKLQDSL